MKTFLLVAITAACGGASEGRTDGGNSTSAFDGACDGTASCGEITVRWTMTRPGGEETCADVDATTVRLTATYQADHRVATFSATCDTSAILTSKLPLGPYALQLDVLDAANEVLDTQPAVATLGTAGSITETDVTFVVTPLIKPGTMFGACSSAQPCMGSLECVPIDGSHGMCTTECPSSGEAACQEAAHAEGVADQEDCYTVVSNSQAGLFCAISCDNGTSCPKGMTCDTAAMFGPVCAPQ